MMNRGKQLPVEIIARHMSSKPVPSTESRRRADVLMRALQEVGGYLVVPAGWRAALETIRDSNGGQCEKSTRGLGACFGPGAGLTTNALHSAYRCCNPCIAARVLKP